jgi:hypothetical protein
MRATNACPAKVGTGFAKKDMRKQKPEQDDESKKVILLAQVNGKTMNNGSPTADAPVPAAGTEQAAAQAARQQPPPESSTKDVVSGVVEGVADVAELAEMVFSIFE